MGRSNILKIVRGTGQELVTYQEKVQLTYESLELHNIVAWTIRILNMKWQEINMHVTKFNGNYN